MTADVVFVDADDAAGLEKYKGTLRGKIVLSTRERPVPPRYGTNGERYTDQQLQDMTQPQQRRAGGPGGGPGGPRGNVNFRAQAAFAAAKLKFFLDEGALAVIDGARGGDGTVFVQQASNPGTYPPPPAPPAGSTPPPPGPRGPSVWEKGAPPNVPQISVAAEQYNRMVRMCKFGVKLRMNLNLKVSFYDKDPMAYNTVAEIPGSDLKDQVVMVGGHMDSWQAATGATDNGAGLACAMEAVRIIKALGIQPRRTIRVALWSGEEEGLFGSRAYVAQHLGSYPPNPNGQFSFNGGNANRGPLTKGPEWDKVSAYYNLDNGTGKIRGIYQQGNEAVGPIFAEWLKPFADLGATTVTIRNTGSTDHVSFDAVGVPGFQFIQDPLDYDTRTHHSNMDTFDHVQGDDLKQASTILAWFLLQTADRDEMMPRKQS